MELRWTPSALEDLDEAGAYVARDNPLAAGKLAARVMEGVEALAVHPNLGRAGRVLGTRELVISGTPFLIVYRVLLGEIHLLRVLHHARKWPAP